jgi:hypothetical protein
MPLDRTRDVKKVPFVELYEGRLQGVVSSGSDIERVYVAYFEANSLNFCCSTNNNRPCGGLRGAPCKHLRELLNEAVIQFGIEDVTHFLRLHDQTIHSTNDILKHSGQQVNVYGSEIFSRFLSDLQLLELPQTSLPISPMMWFTE